MLVNGSMHKSVVIDGRFKGFRRIVLLNVLRQFYYGRAM